MFKYYLLLSTFLVALMSCGNGNAEKSETGKTASAISSLSKMASEAKKVEKDYKELSQATPLTNEQLKAWMPEELSGMKRVSYSIGGTGFLKLTALDASYANEDKSKKIEVNLIDGADSVGASLISLARMGLSQDFENETETEVKKSVEKNGIKAIEEYKKDNSSSSLKFIVKNRFLLTIEGTNLTIDELWKAVKALKPDELG